MAKATATNQDVLAKHGITYMGKKLSAMDIANEALAVSTKAFDLEQEKISFGAHFIYLARTCKNVEEFLSVMGTIEARQSWKSKQNPAGEKTAPSVWTQTKSNMKVAWENFNISPKSIETTQQLNEELNKARKAKKESDKSDDASETATKAIEQASQTTDQGFANLLVKLTKLYSWMESDDEKKSFRDDLAEVYNLYSDTDKDIKELLGDLDSQGVEVQKAAH